MPLELRNQYKIRDRDMVSNLLLAPRAYVKNNEYMVCITCFHNIIPIRLDKPSKFIISNGWAIGKVPSTIIVNEIDDILAAMLAKIRVFASIFSYTGGAHKSIKGHHTFFTRNPELVGGTFKYMMRSGAPPDIYVLISGRATVSQKDIIRKRVSINVDDYKALFSFIIDHHPSFSGMSRSENCPQSILIGGFDNNENNIDESDGFHNHIENQFDGKRMTFVAIGEPTENTSPYITERGFIISYLRGRKPIMTFRNGDYINGQKNKLIYLFP